MRGEKKNRKGAEMLGVNMDDVIALLKSLESQLIIIGVALVTAIVLTIAVNKIKHQKQWQQNTKLTNGI